MVYALSLRLLRLILGRYTPTRVRGSLPEGGLILAGNHPTIIDGLVVGTFSPRRIRFLIYPELFRIPLLGWWLRALGCLSARDLEGAAAAVLAGDCVAIFPEGTNTHGYELGPFRRGVAALSELTGARVVPFGLRGTEELCPGDARYLKSGPVELHFGQSLKPAGSLEERRDAIRRAVGVQLSRTPSPIGATASWISVAIIPSTWLLFQIADGLGFAGRR